MLWEKKQHLFLLQNNKDVDIIQEPQLNDAPKPVYCNMSAGLPQLFQDQFQGFFGIILQFKLGDFYLRVFLTGGGTSKMWVRVFPGAVTRGGGQMAEIGQKLHENRKISKNGQKLHENQRIHGILRGGIWGPEGGDFPNFRPEGGIPPLQGKP